RKVITHCFLLLAISVPGLAQVSQNVQLLDVKILPNSVRYSGSAGYVDQLGNEYGLVGARAGLAAFILEADTLRFIDEVPGPQSNWREIAVLGDYAYVSTEGFGTGQGLQVIDLSSLPNSLNLVTTFDAEFTRGHIVQVDYFFPDSTYVYVAGVTPGGGVRILDVENPAQPELVGTYEPYYIHDVHIRGDIMYAAALYNGTLDIVDISDKSNPQLVTQLSYPNPFTHSAFTDVTGDIIFVCDEIDGTPMRVWDISDLDNPEEIAQYTGNVESLVHNPYVVGDFNYIAHNTEGLRVLDIVDPAVPVEVGFYDTWSDESGGFFGLWSAWPFLPSGRILGGDRFGGLYLWSFNDTYAGRIYGTVTDSLTEQALVNASIELSNVWTSKSDLLGTYAAGAVPGNYQLICSADGYQTKTFSIDLQAMDSLSLDIELLPLSTSVETIKPIQNFELRPNPSQGFLSIRFEAPSDGTLTIRTVQGQEVYSIQLQSYQLNELDISGLANGIYLTTLEVEGLMPLTHKLIIQH
ncbi:MAG: choice-of-anchor B family protein, partial [Bacteroidota bacterium]